MKEIKSLPEDILEDIIIYVHEHTENNEEFYKAFYEEIMNHFNKGLLLWINSYFY